MNLTSTPMLGDRNRRSLADQLYQQLRDRIRSAELVPGCRLPTEKVMTEEFGVSRTTVREAIARLSAEGLVKARQGMGVYVTDDANYEAFQITRDELDNLEDMRRLLELRLAIETEMAEMAARRRTAEDIANLRAGLAAIDAAPGPNEAVLADAELHASIARAAHNHYFERILDFLGTRLIPPRSLVIRQRRMEDLASYAALLAEEHLAIVDAIDAGDPIAARAAVRHHLGQSLDRHGRAIRES